MSWSKIYAHFSRHFHLAESTPISPSRFGLRLRLQFGLSARRYSNGGEKRFAALWGNGDYGRLGLGGLDSQWRPVVCSAFRGADSLRSLSCGGAHTLFLTESGRVYACGLNDFGQLGISDDLDYTMEPTLVPGIEKQIKHISAGYSHSCAITTDGELYMWGKNTNGQLGLGKSAPSVVSRPLKVACLSGIHIEMAALASEHSIAVTDEGVTLSWGEGNSGRLGHDRQSSLLGFLSSACEYTPRVIKRLDGIKVKMVAAGLLHSACVDENGNVFVFGERAMEKLSFGSNNRTGPSLLLDLPISEEIACGGYHTCIITGNRELYTLGSNENGCLGIGYTDVSQSPQRVEGPFLRQPVSKVSCGWKHTAAISGGYVFTWGWGGSHGTFSVDGQSSGGQLGHGTDVDYVEPALVDFGSNVKALEVSCGFNHTGAILEYI
ncbi:ultraviolet-B receptor UVR8 [Silene latifolia]|uniref:ultraviolet-B receptor UVR8 n=1 Tax=Silene latifolia TaxID=37657 RepID=UPI003D77F5BC